MGIEIETSLSEDGFNLISDRKILIIDKSNIL